MNWKIKFNKTDIIIIGILICSAVYHYSTTLKTKPRMTLEEEERLHSGNFNGVYYVDLGLPSGNLWEQDNEGAREYWECGFFTAWGETDEKTEYSDLTYKTYNEKILNKFTTPVFDKKGKICGRTLKDEFFSKKYDLIRRIPTQKDYEELIKECTWEYLGYEGNLLGTSKRNGNTIVFPLTGRKIGEAHEHGFGYYWTSSLNIEDPSQAYYFHISTEKKPCIKAAKRYYGMCTRYITAGFSSDKKQLN